MSGIRVSKGPGVAAFDVGRLRNELRFHLVQTYLLWPMPRRVDSARKLIDRISQRIRPLVPGRFERGPRSLKFKEPLHELLDAMGDADFEEARSSFYVDCESDHGYKSVEGLTAQFLWPVECAFALSFGPPREVLTDRSFLAMDLGELVDRGIRPGNIAGFVIANLPKTLARRRTGPASSRAPRLIRRVPGEVEPTAGWFLEVVQLYSELDLEAALSGEFLALAHQAEGETDLIGIDYSRVTEDLAQGLRAALAREPRGWARDEGIKSTGLAGSPSPAMGTEGSSTGLGDTQGCENSGHAPELRLLGGNEAGDGLRSGSASGRARPTEKKLARKVTVLRSTGNPVRQVHVRPCSWAMPRSCPDGTAFIRSRIDRTSWRW